MCSFLLVELWGWGAEFTGFLVLLRAAHEPGILVGF
jgi:hypothetical protein